MSVARRHRAIGDLLRTQEIGSQVELVDALEGLGFRVTQGTVSRDLRRLGVIKVPTAGGSRYAMPDSGLDAGPGSGEAEQRRLVESLRQSVWSVAEGSRILVLRTAPGHANAVAVAIDGLSVEGIAGTVAGDDTILVVLRKGVAPAQAERVLELLGSR